MLDKPERRHLGEQLVAVGETLDKPFFVTAGWVARAERRAHIAMRSARSALEDARATLAETVGLLRQLSKTTEY